MSISLTGDAFRSHEPAPSGPTPRTMLEVTSLSKAYGSGDHQTQAVQDLSFDVCEGELVCVVGPSGCGKTTLLKTLSGLMAPSGGQVSLLGQRVTSPPEMMALVFQDYSRSLYPWMKVHANVALPLRRMKLSKDERQARIADALESVGLADFADKYPWQLSGGMQQRVAIARALAYRPGVLLMDEPFASVDAQTRANLEDLVLNLRHKYDVTIIFVTHDIDESVYLADRVVVLTPRPATVREIVTVDLPRPRDQIRTKELPEFARLRSHVYELIMKASHDVEPSPDAVEDAGDGA